MNNSIKNGLKSGYRYLILFLLVFSMVFGSANTLRVQAAKTGLSKESITMYTNKTKTLKLKNVTSKVKWRSSNKKLVAITEKKGRYHQRVILRSTGKTGKCKITATVRKKTYVCNITVKDKSKPSGTAGEESLPVSTVDEEKLAREKAAIQNNTNVQTIVAYAAASGETDYADYYGGSYIGEDGNLVVQLCAQAEEEAQKIMDVTDETVTLEAVENSYESLVDAVAKDSARLKELLKQNAAGKLSQELSELADAIVGMETRVPDNVNVVFMKDISDRMQAAYIEYFGDSNVVFEQSTPLQPTTVFSAAPGDSIFTYKFVQKGDTAIPYKISASIGPRMRYVKENGTSVYGFLTAGHLTTEKGAGIYYTKPDGTEVKIGEVFKGQFSDKVDASFIKVTNQNCTISRYSKYVKANGKTGQNFKMCAKCCYGDPVVGQTVYICGAASHLTSGTITSLNRSFKYTIDGKEIWMEDFISTSTNFVKEGDSGASVFYRNHDYLFETVGIVSGSSKTGTVISNIRNIDDAWKNAHGFPLYQY